MALWRPWPRLGLSLVILSIALLYLASTPRVAATLGRMLETAAPLSLSMADSSGARAIVVLGSGAGISAPGAAAVLPTALELERLRYAAELHRATGLPVLTSGDGRGRAGEMRMAGTLREDLGVSEVWAEDRSRDTRDNARNSEAALHSRGVSRVILVTHASHMRRAARAFRATGLEVIAAPTGFRTEVSGTRAWLPDAAALHYVAAALHELAGDLWYKFSGVYAPIVDP
jgi:uncharacterized SAM-binding protein YcdF (DUF218 family)